MKHLISKIIISSAILFGISGLSYTQASPVPPNEKDAIFNAAGFKNVNGAWRGKCSFGHISVFKDFNGDGRSDAIIRDGGTECYASTGVGFHLVTKQANHKWTRILNSPGEPTFLKSIGRHGWPDLIITNPSQCHTVYRWDGNRYMKNRQEYQGKLCGTI